MSASYLFTKVLSKWKSILLQMVEHQESTLFKLTYKQDRYFKLLSIPWLFVKEHISKNCATYYFYNSFFFI